ncbi:hypothetical protein ACFLS0_01165 [Candidatus Bipolaricaulota bacterium]
MKARYLIFGIIVLCFASAALGSDGFTGSWQAEIGISPRLPVPFHSFQSTLDVGLNLSFVTISGISDFLFDGWLWQEFDLEVDLSIVHFDGQMLFEPQSGSFLYAQGHLSFDLGMITLGVYGAITGPTQTASANYGWVFSIAGDILPGMVSFESNTFIGADLSGITFHAATTQVDSTLIWKTFLTDPTIDFPPLSFSGQEVKVHALAFGCVEMDSITTFSKIGFESQEFELTFLNMFGLPFRMTLDIIFTLQTKSYVFTPSLETDFGCLSVYTNLLRTGTTITGVEIYGIAFQFSIAGATLTSVSNLNTAEYVITRPGFGLIVELETTAIAENHLYYPQEYWEIVSLDVDVPPYGCGFSFSVDTFFSTSTGLLFDWAQSTMEVTLALGTSVSASSAITVDITGFTEWSLSVEVSW